MTIERLLFRAGRQGYSYPEILEIRPASFRILVPSYEAKRRAHLLSILVALAYVFIAGTFLGITALAPIQNLDGVVAGVVTGAAVALYILGLIGVLVWWDRWSLPLLAEAPAATIPLELIDTQSFGTFQEIRARAEGATVRVAIPGSRSRLGEAMRFAGVSGTSS